MDKNSIIASFKAQNKPERKVSKLADYRQEILSMSDEGYTQAQIIALLGELGVPAKQSNLSRWIKRQQKSKTSPKKNAVKEEPIISIRQIPEIEIREVEQKPITQTKKTKKTSLNEPSLF